ncbi:MAG TPA: PilC/PilY family type IV pilus protein [Steroidobacter sp.]|uniref:pilus assembly protein n=1 Tax=Steroidobacter sp. TaxID=1978227 RepID=UPI002ED9EA41
MRSLITKILSIAALTMYHCAPQAEDIDLFVGNPADSNGLPNVLFILDNTANWSAAFQSEVAALANTFAALPENPDGTARFNIGLMFAAETGSGNNSVSGGYMRAAIRPMTADNKRKYSAMIAALDVGTDKGNAGASSLVMAEAYRYLSGGAPYAGNNKAKTDFTGNTGADWSSSATTPASLAAMRQIYALPGNALSSKGATTYNFSASSRCGRNYIVYISNGAPQDNNQFISQSNSLLAAAGGDTTQIPVSPTGSQTNVSDEWARFMQQGSLRVTTYAIDVDPSSSGQGPGWSRVLFSMSEGVGGGRYIGVSSSVNAGQEIANAVTRVLSEIQAVNSVFASVSLPVSTNTQGAHANQVFIGMFRPQAGAYPRWVGNLKQYQLGFVNGVLRLVDADRVTAINNTTGFITECARSFWTPTTPDNYWAFSPAGECIPPTGSTPTLYRVSNFPDGNIVEKGAHAFKLRGSAARTLRTCTPGACSSLSNFNTANSNITQARLGAASTTERETLIDWASGVDVDDENRDTVRTTMRPSTHGDVVHSRPMAIDFGTPSAPKVVVFYGGNDGIFRAVNGNTSASIGTVPAGGELWGFVPPEFYSHIKRLRDNTAQISFPYVTSVGAAPKPYAIDGPITAFTGSSSTAVYAPMRRGGRGVYAFGVSNSDPATVTLKWRKGCLDNFPVTGVVSDSNCDSGLTGIGQTWSAAKPIKTAGYAAGASPLIVMGGGYDTCEDRDPHTCTSATKGNKIYVLDADSGALLKTFDTARGVIADIAIVPDRTTGLAKYAYAVDLGGNVYRIDIGTVVPASWTITRIASLGCSTTDSCPNNRKLMFVPDILDDNGEYVLLFGSGDREKPLRTYTAASSVTNYFFMLRDRPTDSTWLSSEASTCGAAVLCLDSLWPITGSADPSPADLALKKGWYLGMRPSEQVVTSALTIFGAVSFSTHTPDVAPPGACTSRLGTARVYNVSYLNAARLNGRLDRSAPLPPDTGLPPSPVAGMVDMGDRTVAYCIGCGDNSAIDAKEPPIPSTSAPRQPKGRVYWYIQR